MKNEQWRDVFLSLVNERKPIITSRGAQRLTFLIGISHFVSRTALGSKRRNIEPALAFQLELGRLSNYSLTPTFVEKQQIHIYHAVARESQLDKRFFIRALARPGRLRGGLSTADYLISESDRLMGSIPDAVEIVSAQHRNTDCNHIQLNFIYNLQVTYEEVLQVSSIATASVSDAWMLQELRFKLSW